MASSNIFVINSVTNTVKLLRIAKTEGKQAKISTYMVQSREVTTEKCQELFCSAVFLNLCETAAR